MKPCSVSDGCTSGEVVSIHEITSKTIAQTHIMSMKILVASLIQIKATGLGHTPLDVSSRELGSQVTQLSAIIASSRGTKRRIYFLQIIPPGEFQVGRVHGTHHVSRGLS